LNVEDEDLDDLLGDDNKEVSTRKLRGAFLKMNQNRLTNRVLLSKVIEEIA
jgi:ribonuclease I